MQTTPTPKLTIDLTEANVKEAIALWLNHHGTAGANWTADKVQLNIKHRSEGYGMSERDVPYLSASAEASVEIVARG